MKIILSVIFIGGIIFFAYRFGIRVGKSQAVVSTNTTEDKIILPACYSGSCPKYVSVDVDGDNLSESVVYQPMGTTKGTAIVMIIKDNKIVFSKGGAQFSYKINSETNENDTGITTKSVDEWDESGLIPKTWRLEKWVYINNDYVLNSKEIIPFKIGDL